MDAYLSIGSNIRPKKNIPACIRKLKDAFRVKKVSSIYETSPVGPVGKGYFWNLALKINTALSREKLRRALRAVEAEMGRKRRGDKFASRPIDIDLIGYNKSWRPGFEKLAFVLFPLAEIAPGLRIIRRGAIHCAQGGINPAPTLRQRVRLFRDPAQKIQKIRKAGLP